MPRRGELQNKVLAFLVEYISAHGQSPTLAEIATFVGITPPAVLFHLRSLEKKGSIIRSGENRGITLRQELDFTNIPVLGIANASTPLDMAEETRMGYLQVDRMIIRNKGNLFAVKINGDSMNLHLLNDSHVPLRHGNYAIVDREKEIKQGDVVLAIVNGGATIKIYRETNEGVVLMPHSSNPVHHPIYIRDKEQLVINGKIVLALDNPALR